LGAVFGVLSTGLEMPKIEDTPPPSAPRVPVKDALQEVPEEGQ